MKRPTRDTWDQKGFTLLEIIVTIVIAALAGLMVFTFVSGIVARSGQPVLAVQALAENRLPLEELAKVYDDYLQGDMSLESWEAFKAEDTIVDHWTEVDISGEGFEVLQVTFSGEQNQELSVLFSQ